VTLSVVVVIHDSARHVAALLASIERHLDPPPQVVVVDSGSRDDGAAVARAHGAHTIVLDGNPGFGAASNAGLEHAAHDVTVLLNPDCELIDGSLGALAGRARTADALLVPRLLERDSAVQRSAHPLPGGAGALVPGVWPPRAMPRPMREHFEPWRAAAPRRVGWAIAACVAARTDLLRRLGPFDPTAFLFYEDLELCLRARAAGFPVELRPRTLITRSLERVRAFLRELDGPAIIKPLAGFGGKNVFFVDRGQTANLAQMISTVRRDGYVIVQEYLPAAAKGDKRVLLVGGAVCAVGDVVAAYRRMRPKDDIRNNMHVGGSRKRCTFSEAEARVCDLLRPRLVADGLYFVGVDLVGDKILEINVFAPGGIANINDLYEIDAATAIIRDLERKVELRSVYPDPIPPHVFMRA